MNILFYIFLLPTVLFPEINQDKSLVAIDSFLERVHNEYNGVSGRSFDLKKVYDTSLNENPEHYIYYLKKALSTQNDLSPVQKADIHFHIAERIYALEDYHLALTYLNTVIDADQKLLDSHYQFLAGIVHTNEKNDPTTAIELFLEVEKHYIEIKHPNLIRLYSAVALNKGENGFPDQAIKFYNKGLEFARQWPNHKFNTLLYGNYLHFLSARMEPSEVGIKKEVVRDYIRKIKQDGDKIREMMGYALKMVYSEYFHHTKDDILEEIDAFEAITKNLLDINANYGVFKRVEFYTVAAEALQKEGVKDYQNALNYIDHALNLMCNYEHKSNSHLIMAKKIKAEILNKLHKNADAYLLSKSIDSLNMVHFTELKAKEITKLASQFELSNATLKNELLEQKYKKLNWVLFSTLGFLAIITLILLSLYSLYNSNRKLNVKLRKSAENYRRTNKELEEVNRDNVDLINRLNISNTYLKNFASIAAHDLKAPIRTISGFTGLINRRYRTQMRVKDQEWLEFINSDLKRLSQMVDDFLKFSQFSTDPSERKEIDISSLLEIVVTNLNSDLKGKDVKIRLAHHLPIIKSYRSLLFQLFLNILGNAIKFSKPYSTNTITIDWKQLDLKTIQFTIEDTGIGIPENYKSDVLTMFTSYGDDEKGGYGIGLATCHRIVSFLNGNLEIESNKDIGTKVIFTIETDIVIDENDGFVTQRVSA